MMPIAVSGCPGQAALLQEGLHGGHPWLHEGAERIGDPGLALVVGPAGGGRWLLLGQAP